jgi:pyruvate formate lyase activating enzyme
MLSAKSMTTRKREPSLESGFVREALLQERVGTKVRCNACARRCLLADGGTGWCRTRENRAGTLVTLIYGSVSSLSANSIEKKPFFHFYPGTYALTAGSWSCNFACPWCQNSDISTVAPPTAGEYVSPEAFVRRVPRHFCQGTSFSFNEPTLSLEWALDAMRLARGRGLYNTFVTNGYMTPEALDLLARAGLQAMNVDVKGSGEAVRRYVKGADIERVWETCRLARDRGVHLEITTLLIPGVNDAARDIESIAGRIAGELGREVPWHLSGYRPAHRFSAPSTPREALELAWRIATEAGLRYVYFGNRPGSERENTWCPECGELLIQRLGFEVLRNGMRAGRCPRCGEKIPGLWGPVRVRAERLT